MALTELGGLCGGLGCLCGGPEPRPRNKDQMALTELGGLCGGLGCLCGDATGTSYEVLPYSANDRICSRTDNNSFFFYADLIHNLGVTLSFTDLEIRVLNELRLAPSQLHPNTWSFLRAFQKYCGAKGLVCTVRLFLWMYNPFVNNKDGVTSRLWVSAKAQAHCGLFGMFTDSWKHFKPKFFKYKYVGTGLPWFRTETGPKFPLEWTPEFFNRHISTPQRWSGAILDADEAVTAHHFQIEYRARKFQLDIGVFMRCPDNEVLTRIDKHWSDMSSKALKAALGARKRKRSENPSAETVPAETSTDTTSTDSAPLNPTPPAVIIAPPPPQSPSLSAEVVIDADTPPSSSGPRRGSDMLPRPPTTIAKPTLKDALIKMSGAEWKKTAEEMACQLKRETTMFNVLAEVSDDVAEGVSPAKKKARSDLAAEVADHRNSKNSADQKLAELEEKHRQQMEELLKKDEEAVAEIREEARKSEEAAKVVAKEDGPQEGLTEVEKVRSLLRKRAAQALKHKIAASETDFDFEKGGGKIFASVVEQILHLNQGLRIRVVGASAGFGVHNGKMVDWERDGAEVDLDQPEENLPNPLAEKPDEEFNPSLVVLSDVEDEAA
ncbi:hypothetical protein RIF29_15593 [Crotalaria pallida]|uniref:Uncharacterized protein n=1 Tax=Crotalaria pallida TaxID=3830 RepID=A0AAN9FHG7_CROPI